MLEILMILIGLFLFSAVFLYFFKGRSVSEKNETHYKKFDDYGTKDDKSSSSIEKSKSQANPNKSSPTTAKSNKRGNLKRRTDKSNYSHNWLLTTLKGHTGAVLDMDFSSNGKYLASCADDPTSILQIDGEISDVTNETSTSSEDSPKQIKRCINRNRKNNSNNRNRNNNNNNSKSNNNNNNCKENKMSNPMTNSNQYHQQQQTKNIYLSTLHEKLDASRFRALEPPLRQHTKLNLTECQLVGYLKHYLLDETLLRLLGFPVVYDVVPNLAIIYKYPPYEFLSMRKDNNTTTFSNATVSSSNPNFYYYTTNSDQIIVNANDGLTKENFGSEVNNDSDSGQGSGSSSPSTEGEYPPQEKVQPPFNPYAYSVSPQKQCIRCGKGFFVTYDGEYLTKEQCVYHWGKLYRTVSNNTMKFVYSCCNREFCEDGSNGCTMNRFHVWTGLNSGLNGPFDGYVRTQPRPYQPEDGNTGIFALDCEMCFTGCGLELTKITIIRSDGRLHYQTFVRPEHDIVDYNTRFSGITEKDLANINCSRRSSTTSTASSRSITSSSVKTLKEVQNDILKFIYEDTILIGHSIDNDLKALKLIHKTVIDTSIAFPHFYGLPYRRSLKSLTKSILRREIQQSDSGHCSFEDSRACLELMLWKVRKDFRTVLEQI